jgi:hypothetical protein
MNVRNLELVTDRELVRPGNAHSAKSRHQTAQVSKLAYTSTTSLNIPKLRLLSPYKSLSQ